MRCFFVDRWILKLIAQLFCQLIGTFTKSLITDCFCIFFYVSSQYITLLLLVFLVELTVGTLAYIYERNVSEELNRTLSDTFMKNYGISERHSQAIDHMQQNFMCCGAVRFEEYRQSAWLTSKRENLTRATENRLVPDSCCVTMSESCGDSDHPSNIPYTVRRFVEQFQSQKD